MIDASGLKVPGKSYHLANKAIDYALSSLTATDLLTPFAMTWNDDGPLIECFNYEAYDDSIEMAMRHIGMHAEGSNAYAVVWNGYVEVDGRKRHAVIAEVRDSTSPHSLQLAQPYAENREGAVIAEGEMLAIGESDNLLHMKLDTQNMARHLLQPAYVTSHALTHALTDQAYAQMPIALICMAANLFDGRETEHIMQGIRKLQALEADRSVAICHHVFGVLAAEVADGDLLHVLPTDDLHDMAAIVLAGGAQINEAVQRGLLSAHDARSYLAANRAILEASLVAADLTHIAPSGQRLMQLLDKAAGN